MKLFMSIDNFAFVYILYEAMRILSFYSDVVPTHLTKILVADLSLEHSEKGNYQPRVGLTSNFLFKEEALHTSIP